jgi:hypothetical protein
MTIYEAYQREADFLYSKYEADLALLKKQFKAQQDACPHKKRTKNELIFRNVLVCDECGHSISEDS